jgi:hypothetical protein
MENKQKKSLYKHLSLTGNVLQSCLAAGIDRNMYYRIIYRDKDFRTAVNKARAEFIMRDTQ